MKPTPLSPIGKYIWEKEIKICMKFSSFRVRQEDTGCSELLSKIGATFDRAI